MKEAEGTESGTWSCFKDVEDVPLQLRKPGILGSKWKNQEKLNFCKAHIFCPIRMVKSSISHSSIPRRTTCPAVESCAPAPPECCNKTGGYQVVMVCGQNRLTTGIFYGDIIYIYHICIYIYVYHMYIYIYTDTAYNPNIVSHFAWEIIFIFFFYGTILGYITSLRGFIRWDWYDLSNTGGCDKHFMG